MRKQTKLTVPWISLIVLMLCSLIPASLQAQEINPEEAITWGVEHNIDLVSIRNDISGLERTLEILDAAESFQVDLSATPIWRFGEDSTIKVTSQSSQASPSTEVSLSATKLIMADFNLSTELSWETNNLNQFDFDEINDEINASIDLNKTLYPDTLTENEKQIYTTENNLAMKIAELRWKEMEKQIEFIEDYLNIIRIEEQLVIARERVTLAQAELDRVNEQIKLGEGGYQQQTEAQIALEEALNQALNQEHQFIQAKARWVLTLGLPQDTEIILEDNPNLVKTLNAQMKALVLEQEKENQQINDALNLNYQIQNSERQKETLVKELEWTEAEGKPKVNLAGGYEYPNDNWYVMVGFSVNLTDGGAQELKEEQKQVDIEQQQVNLDYLAEQLKLEAEQLYDQDTYNQLNLQTQELALAKEQDKYNIMEMQFQQGAISRTQLDQEKLVVREKEIAVRQAEDQWLINRLELAYFLGFLEQEM